MVKFDLVIMEQLRKFERQEIGFKNIYKLFLYLAFITISEFPLRAQDSEVPRTQTFPTIENPAFPYAQPEDVGLSSEKLNQVGNEIIEWVTYGELIGGELLIIKNGKAVFHVAYGWADREERRPMERNSIFSIKSMSKPFTAMAILMLCEEGKLSLNDTVSLYISTFTNDSTTIRHRRCETELQSCDRPRSSTGARKPRGLPGGTDASDTTIGKAVGDIVKIKRY